MIGEWNPQWVVVLGAMYAMLLGGAIGFEREMKNRPAGFRTHMLVSGAAALLVGMGPLILGNAEFHRGNGALQLDPIRLVEATITGVAFIGAGTIFSRRGAKEHVAGITTAASLLMVAVIGIVVALRFYLLALLATGLTLVVLFGLSWVERRFKQED